MPSLNLNSVYAQDLRGFFPLNSECDIRDLSLYGNNGRISLYKNYARVIYPAGDNRQGMQIGVNNLLDFGEAKDLEFERDQPFSVSYWCKPDYGVSHYVECAVEKSNTVTDYITGWLIYHNSKSVWFSMVSVFGDNNQLLVNTDSNLLVAGIWNHIVVTYDGTSSGNGVHMYANGIPVNVNIHTDNLTGSILGDCHMRFGGRNGNIQYLKGILSDVRIYTRVLSELEVIHLHHQTANGLYGDLILYDDMCSTPVSTSQFPFPLFSCV